MPGGASGVAAKLKMPYTAVCADSAGLRRDARNRLSVSVHCGMRRSHSFMGYLGSMVQRPAIRWFLYVRMALSAAFLLWIWGGTSWKDTLFLRNDFFMSSEHSLSNMWRLGASP